MLGNIRDRLLSIELKRDEKEVKIGFVLVGIILILLLGNIIYLNLNFSKAANNSVSATPSSVATISPSVSPAATASPKPVAIPTIAPQSTATVNLQNNVKDYYFNLGSGSNQSTDWVDVSGALSTFDIAQYQNIKEVHLETNIDVPTANGTVSVRLFNKTDNYVVWNSQREVQSQTKGDLIISNNIIYDVGPRLYQVQMKSQLGVPANLVQSRIHITVQ